MPSSDQYLRAIAHRPSCEKCDKITMGQSCPRAELTRSSETCCRCHLFKTVARSGEPDDSIEGSVQEGKLIGLRVVRPWYRCGITWLATYPSGIPQSTWLEPAFDIDCHPSSPLDTTSPWLKSLEDTGGILHPRSVQGDLKLARRWLASCDVGHDDCCQPLRRPRASYPTRVMDLKQGVTGLRLVDLDRSSVSVDSYVTLSHRWGNREKMSVTLKTNIEQRRKHISLESLPRNFQDAVFLVCGLELDIPYLWIDALCIVQDDAADLQSEIMRMGSIYRYSYFTIAADCADNPDAGLWPNGSNDRIPLPVKRYGYQGWEILALEQSYESISERAFDEAFCRARLDSQGLVRGHLMERGWIFQEMVLSKRTLHFTASELIWRCDSVLECQCRLPAAERSAKERLSRLLNAPSLTQHSACDDWVQMVKEYSSRRLTVSSDRLPALSGVVELLKLDFRDYMAGIWRQVAPKQLLWYSAQHEKPSYDLAVVAPEATISSKAYGPSWSWVSMEGAVAFSEQLEQTVWHVKRIETTPLSNINPLGEVSGGTLQVSSLAAHLHLLWPWSQVYEGACAKQHYRDAHITRRSHDSNQPCDENCWGEKLWRDEVRLELLLDSTRDWTPDELVMADTITSNAQGQKRLERSLRPSGWDKLSTFQTVTERPVISGAASQERSLSCRFCRNSLANDASGHLLLFAAVERREESDDGPSEAMQTYAVGLILRKLYENGDGYAVWRRVGFFRQHVRSWEKWRQRWGRRCRMMDVTIL